LDAPILICGGGLGGLTAALALLRRGFDVEVYEQARELGEVGAGVQMSANGTLVLHELGLAKELAAVGVEPQGKEIRLWNTGDTWKLFDLGTVSTARYGFPYYMLHRADLHRLLADAVRRLKPGAIRLGQKLAEARQNEGGVLARFEGGGKSRGRMLVGADGIHSAVRQQLFGAMRSEFTGCIAWRGLVETARLPAHLARPVGTNWIGPGRHVVQYPVKAGKLLNFVGIVERQGWQVESWTERGTTAECLADFEGWHQDVRDIISLIDAPQKWALMGREPMEAWSVGRVGLLGDACHPTLPFLAQGAMMALEDGLMLARCMEKYGADPALALERFAAARKDRTARIVRGSADNARRFHNPLLATREGARNYVDTQWTEERVTARYAWLFEYDARSAPV
jgi:salicylate hydroxylase